MGADDPVQDCVFPFTRTDYDGVTRTHEECTLVDNINGKPWCSTEVDDNGVHTGQWFQALSLSGLGRQYI